jgi:hypothetical protein
MTKTNNTPVRTAETSEPKAVVRTRDEFGRGGAYVVPAFKVEAMRRFAGTIGGEYRDR